MSEHDSEYEIENSLENEEQDISISQVGENIKQPLSTLRIILISFAMIFLFILVITSGDDNSENDKKIQFTEEEYEVKKTYIPRRPEKPIEKKKNTPKRPDKKTLSQIPKNDSNKPTQAELEALRKAHDLMLRRKHSPIVLVNKQNSKNKKVTRGNRSDIKKIFSNASNELSEFEKNSDKRMDSLLKSTKEMMNRDNKKEKSTPFTSGKSTLGNIETSKTITVEANYITDLSYKIFQGKVIPAILETAIQSDLAGMLRAIVSEPVYSEDGNSLLIPKGSRLIGEYQGGIKQGKARIFIIWSRLVRSDGISIKIDSHNTDSIGVSGLAGYIDYHFLERFGASIMMSLISGFAQSGAQNDNQIYAMSDSFAKSSEVILENSIDIEPTLYVNQGEKINVFIAKDLNFKNALIIKHNKDI